MSQTVVVARHRDEVLEGVRAMAPMLVVYAPFGLLVGAAVAASDNPVAAWLSTWTIYGGAAHLAVLDVLHNGTGVLGAAVVGLLINARMVAYAASLAPHWRTASVRSRVAAAAMLTDATWGLTLNHPSDSAAVRRRFYFGAASRCGRMARVRHHGCAPGPLGPGCPCRHSSAGHDARGVGGATAADPSWARRRHRGDGRRGCHLRHGRGYRARAGRGGRGQRGRTRAQEGIMTTVVALLLVGAGSLAYRLVPLLGAARVPEAVSRVAGWAGVSVLSAVTVRGVLHHHDRSIPWAVPVAVVSLAVALVVAARGRGILVVLGAGAGTYLALSTVIGALT